ncbi:MAG: bacteriohemerythrin [Alphaproteobacteria bacterium]|nr:bacteriohemerythrin [Alphaproteobacteria bacterium]
MDRYETASVATMAEAFDSLEQAILILDDSERIVYVSDGFRRLFDLKERACHVRAGYADVIQTLIERGEYGDSDIELILAERLQPVRNRQKVTLQRIRQDGRVIDETGAPMSNGGYVFSFTEVRKQSIAIDRLTKANRATVLALADLAEFRDTDTGGHVVRVARLTQEITRALDHARAFPQEIDQDFRAKIGVASILHDVGKVAISDSVLRKPGLLDDTERLAMQSHSAVGAAILSKALSLAPDSGYLRIAVDIARHHHERYDGGGYPDKLQKSKIPLAARIVAVADVFDALTSARSYKQAWSEEEATSYLASMAGQQFDPQVISAALFVLDERRKTPIIRWSDAMSVGNKDLDHDHQTLIGLVNQVSMPANRSDHTVLEFVLDELLGYTSAHFTREEEHLRRIGFADLDRHMDIHRTLVSELTTIRKNFYAGKGDIGEKVSEFVAEWLRNHILLEDKTYAT